MTQADRVYSTPPTSSSAILEEGNSAPGAVQLSSPKLIPDSGPIAGQGVKNEGEPSGASQIPQSGTGMNRRTLMNLAVKSAALMAAPAVALSPVAALAAPETDRRALEAYASWLFMERRILCGELWPHMGAVAEKFDFAGNAGWGWHFRGEIDWRDHPQPSTRAAAVLDLVGVDWRGRKEDDRGLGEFDNGARPMLPTNWPERDGELREALESLKAHDLALAGLHKVHGDEADSREDYQELEEARDDCLSP